MKLTFTKRDGKYDDLLIERPGLQSETIRCPTQGIIPHDMVHFAVEGALAHRGFFSLLADGAPASYATAGGDSEEAVERLVETFQAEMWGERVPAADLIATYEHACGARAHPAMPVSTQDVEAIRARLDALTASWSEIGVNQSLTVAL